MSQEFRSGRQVHCLLQLPRLKDALGGQMVVVELADVGPAGDRRFGIPGGHLL